jgi:hypothetical protein
MHCDFSMFRGVSPVRIRLQVIPVRKLLLFRKPILSVSFFRSQAGLCGCSTVVFLKVV